MKIYEKIIKYTSKFKYDRGALRLGWPWNALPHLSVI